MRRWRWGFLALLYVFLIFGGSLLGHWFSQIAAIDVRPLNEPQVHRMVMTATLVYIIASALPFVPGAEIGFALILALGPRIAVLVYGAMVLALLLSYLVGRFVPYSATAAIFGLFGLHKARDMVLQMARLDAAGRLAMLTANAPQRIVPFLIRHRFLALAAAINIPGNSLIGGGGGIALVAGMSGIYPLPRYLLTIALAVAPIPVLVLSTGHLPTNRVAQIQGSGGPSPDYLQTFELRVGTIGGTLDASGVHYRENPRWIRSTAPIRTA